MITLIAAAGINNELGKDNDLVWHLPIDFKRFKELTTNHHIIMGRKTFESFPKLLPNRIHIIITRNATYQAEGAIIVHSMKEALRLVNSDDQPFIIGGGEIYKQALPYANRLELTRVHGIFEGDTFFPEIDLNEWQEVQREFISKDDIHAYDFSFITYKKQINT